MKNRDVAFQKAFGLHLKALREGREWSQRQLAAVSGIDETQISRIENGVQSANLQTILALTQALGKYPSELFQFEFDFNLNEDFSAYHQKGKTTRTTATVTRLAGSNFFDIPRSVSDVISQCRKTHNIILQSAATSAVLRKLVKAKILKRLPSGSGGKFLYQKRK